MVWRGLLPPPSLPDSRTDRAGTPRKIPRPFVVDRNICHFLWYSGVAGEGLRSVGADGELPTKSECSILPLAHHLRAGVLRGSGRYNARIVGRAMMFPILSARPFALPRPHAAWFLM